MSVTGLVHQTGSCKKAFQGLKIRQGIECQDFPVNMSRFVLVIFPLSILHIRVAVSGAAVHFNAKFGLRTSRQHPLNRMYKNLEMSTLQE